MCIRDRYIDALPRMVAADGRVHTSFNEMVTTTGRLSSSDPNWQNIPVRTEFGRNIRTCFVPLHECEVFLSADYSQTVSYTHLDVYKRQSLLTLLRWRNLSAITLL